MPHQRLGRQYARLIKPTRDNVPTEYNVQYKRWNKTGHATRQNTSGAPSKKETQHEYERIRSSTDPNRYQSLLHARPWTTETDKSKAYSRPNSYGIDFHLSETSSQKHDANYQSAGKEISARHDHSRPRSRTPAPAKILYETEEDLERNRLDESRKNRKNSKRPPTKPKTAWAATDDNHKVAGLTKSSRPSSASRKTRTRKPQSNDELHVDASSLLNYASSIVKSQESITRPGSTDASKKTDRPSSRYSKKRYRYSFPKEENEIDKASHLGKATSSVPGFRKSANEGGVCSIEERNLRKIYANATDDELRRLFATIRSIGRDSAAKKQCSKSTVSNDSSDPSLSKEDLDKIRQAAFRSCNSAPKFCRKDVWSTTYGKAFCRKWKSEDYVSPFSGDFPVKEEKTDIIITDHYVSSEFAQKKKISNKKSETSLGDNDGQDSDDESSCGSTNGRSRTPLTEPSSCMSMADWPGKQVEDSESQKILKEGNELEEKDYKHLFKDDGRPKMKCDTTTGLAHNGAQGPKYDDPVWADETLKSLGSGHWNLLYDHYDGWEDKVDKNKKLSEMIPKKRENDKYKVVVYDKGEPAPVVKSPLTKEMVFGKYGGGGVPRKTHVCYVTEYMGKFTQMPLPRNTRRVH